MVVFFSSVPKPNNHWRIWCQREYFYRNSISTFFAPKSRSSFVANIRYIVYDCSSSIGQRCAGSCFAIPNIGHHSAIVPLLALYRRLFCHSILYLYSIVLLLFHATIVLAHYLLLRLNLSLMIGIAFLGYLSDNLADLPTAHCRLNTLSVVIPHLWVLFFTQRSLIPRISTLDWNHL